MNANNKQVYAILIKKINKLQKEISELSERNEHQLKMINNLKATMVYTIVVFIIIKLLFLII